MRNNESCIITMIPQDTCNLDKEIIMHFNEAFKQDAKEVICEVEEYGSGQEYELEVYLLYKKKGVN